jgi:hypothetical protein
MPDATRLFSLTCCFLILCVCRVKKFGVNVHNDSTATVQGSTFENNIASVGLKPVCLVYRNKFDVLMKHVHLPI